MAIRADKFAVVVEYCPTACFEGVEFMARGYDLVRRYAGLMWFAGSQVWWFRGVGRWMWFASPGCVMVLVAVR